MSIGAKDCIVIVCNWFDVLKGILLDTGVSLSLKTIMWMCYRTRPFIHTFPACWWWSIQEFWHLSAADEGCDRGSPAGYECWGSGGACDRPTGKCQAQGCVSNSSKIRNLTMSSLCCYKEICLEVINILINSKLFS